MRAQHITGQTFDELIKEINKFAKAQGEKFAVTTPVWDDRDHRYHCIVTG